MLNKKIKTPKEAPEEKLTALDRKKIRLEKKKKAFEIAKRNFMWLEAELTFLQQEIAFKEGKELITPQISVPQAQPPTALEAQPPF